MTVLRGSFLKRKLPLANQPPQEVDLIWRVATNLSADTVEGTTGFFVGSIRGDPRLGTCLALSAHPKTPPERTWNLSGKNEQSSQILVETEEKTVL